MKTLKIFITLLLIVTFGFPQKVEPQDPEVAGKIFGNSVPRENYYFLLKVVLSFQSPWGGIPGNREQLEKRLWDEIILSYEAHRRQITVTQPEIEAKVGETLKSSNVIFDWKTDNHLYAQWARETLNESVETFENQMRHLAKVQKLHKLILEGINTQVTDDEAFQEFLNEQNSLSVELAEFDDPGSAQQFYQKVIEEPEEWVRASEKDKNTIPEDRTFRKPGFVTLEFLMDMWGFPRDTVYKMITLNKGEFHPPAPIYKGYGVFKILEIRLADTSKYTENKEYYIDQLRIRKKYRGFDDWLSRLRREADLESYMDIPYEIFP